MSNECIFCKIIQKEIPAEILFENDEILAFRDVHPQAPVHFLVIPKKHIASLNETSPEDAAVLGQIILLIPKLAKEQGIFDSGYRLIQNNGKQAGQTVSHIHFHLLGGRRLKWPPG